MGVIAVIGAASLTITVLVAGSPHAIIAEGLLATAAAVLAGASRRQYQDRAAQAEQLLAERTRADAERDRAAALAERNRIGREVHDLLAHSLGALCVQLDAADALLETGGDPTKARQLVQHARRLAVDGLGETRRAVHALREQPIGLTEQLTALAATDGAQLTVTGTQRSLTPDAELALYRAAQEAVSNARKHAPGARSRCDSTTTGTRPCWSSRPARARTGTPRAAQPDRCWPGPARHARAHRTARPRLDRPCGGAHMRAHVRVVAEPVKTDRAPSSDCRCGGGGRRRRPGRGRGCRSWRRCG